MQTIATTARLPRPFTQRPRWLKPCGTPAARPQPLDAPAGQPPAGHDFLILNPCPELAAPPPPPPDLEFFNVDLP